jgi:hypothetical protein
MKSILKTIIAAGALAATAFATSAQAADYEPVMQYSDWAFRFEGAAGYEGITIEEDGDPDENIDAGIFNTAFSAAFQGPVVFAQLDGVFGTSHGHDNGFAASNTQFTGGIFLGWRDMNTGVLAGNLAVSGYEDNIAPALLRAGGHGELFLDMFTIGAAGGIITPLTVSGNDAGYAKGLVRFYVNDNLKLEGHGGVVFEGSEDDDGELVYGRALAEWKPDESRISYFARWDGVFFDAGGQEFSSHAAMAGIRVYFGEPETTTIKSQDRVHFTDSCAFGTAGQTLSIC